jgi:hypothetical protein
MKQATRSYERGHTRTVGAHVVWKSVGPHNPAKLSTITQDKLSKIFHILVSNKVKPLRENKNLFKTEVSKYAADQSSVSQNDSYSLDV